MEEVSRGFVPLLGEKNANKIYRPGINSNVSLNWQRSSFLGDFSRRGKGEEGGRWRFFFLLPREILSRRRVGRGKCILLSLSLSLPFQVHREHIV